MHNRTAGQRKEEGGGRRKEEEGGRRRKEGGRRKGDGGRRTEEMCERERNGEEKGRKVSRWMEHHKIFLLELTAYSCESEIPDPARSFVSYYLESNICKQQQHI